MEIRQRGAKVPIFPTVRCASITATIRDYPGLSGTIRDRFIDISTFYVCPYRGKSKKGKAKPSAKTNFALRRNMGRGRAPAGIFRITFQNPFAHAARILPSILF